MGDKTLYTIRQGDAMPLTFAPAVDGIPAKVKDFIAAEFVLSTPTSSLHRFWRADGSGDACVTVEEHHSGDVFVIQLTQADTMMMDPGALYFAYRVLFRGEEEYVSSEKIPVGVIIGQDCSVLTN